VSKPIEFSVKFVLHTLVCKLATSQWTETHPYKLIKWLVLSFYFVINIERSRTIQRINAK